MEHRDGPTAEKEFTMAELTWGKKLKPLGIHFLIFKMGRITAVSQWRRVPPGDRKWGKERGGWDIPCRS